MKITGKIVILAIIAVIVSAVAIAGSAWSIGARPKAAAACCCCKSAESCPMKKKDVSAKEAVTTDDKCACCKDGSCTMKKKDSAAKDTAMSCDKCACCKDGSCPMKKDGHHGITAMETTDTDGPPDSTMGCCGCCAKGKDAKKPSNTVIDIVSYR